VHIERQRAQAAYDLIDFYNQMSKGDTARLDAMRKEGRAGRRQVAVILRRLNTVAKEVDLSSADKVRQDTETMSEMLSVLADTREHREILRKIRERDAQSFR
jgi:hypothetical protein